MLGHGEPHDESSMLLAALETADGGFRALLSCHSDIGAVTLGRGAGATVRVTPAYVARVHSTITWDAERGMHVIEDAGSGNGTFVNERRVAGRLGLLNGSRIRIGQTTLHYRRLAKG
jgi:pSer/pThr/pTyr-binding forkhead associated (FHA) protein